MRPPYIRTIHACARAAGLDEDTRRAVYRRVMGRESLTEMSDGQVKLLALEFRRLSPAQGSAKAKPKAAGAASKAKARAPSAKPHVRLLYALWWRLADAGLVAEGCASAEARRKALNAFLNTRFKGDLNGLQTDVEFLPSALAVKAAEALKAMAERGGLKLEAGR